MAFHCMNCNGSMVFDVASQKMRCLHCDSTCDPDDFVFRDESPEAGGQAFVADGEMAVFTCQNCGAELESTEDSLIGFCPYCGGQSMVKRVSGSSEVERIIPFQVSKEQCLELYSNYVRHVRYLPRELRDPEYIKKFTGIYMPFYQYDAEFDEVYLTGTKTVEHNRRYDVENTYRIDGTVEESYERGVTFDGSKYLDDEISARVLPFDHSKERPFNPGYLSGFYADATSVPPELYLEDARVRAEEDIVNAMGDELHRTSGISMGSTSSVHTVVTGHHSMLLPMWFLTWRKDDRVAYAVINGESGEVVSDMPLDLRSFAFGCVIISAVLFVIMELLFQPTPMVTSIVSLVAALLMAYGIRLGAKREYEQQVHAYDKGWGGGDDTPVEKEVAKVRRRKRVEAKGAKRVGEVLSIVFFMLFCTMTLGMTIMSSSTGSSLLKLALPMAVLIYAIVVCVRILKWRKYIGRLDPVVAIFVLLATVVLNSAIVLISPVNDGWYYIGDAVCIVGLAVSAVGMLRTYNVSTTRPLPKLFDREEV